MKVAACLHVDTRRYIDDDEYWLATRFSDLVSSDGSHWNGGCLLRPRFVCP